MITIFSLAWLMIVILTQSETAHEIEELFDAQLAQEAGIVFDISTTAIEKGILLNDILNKTSSGHRYENKISFQILQGKQLLFRSHNAPVKQLSVTLGYSDQIYHQEKWRIFVTKERFNSKVYTVITAEEYAIRNELVNDIVLQSILPVLFALPLLVFLLHFAIKKGLMPLQAIAVSVEQKGAMDFSPIKTKNVPDEISTVIDALNKLIGRLKIAFDKERRFTTNAAHELRTPIAAIQLQAQVAKRSFKNKQQLMTSLDNIIFGTQRSSHLVEQMLTLARLEPEAITDKFCKENIINSIQESISESIHSAIKKEIEIVLTARPETGCIVSHYQQGIVIMLNNLLQNAIRYTPAKGIINIELDCDEDSYSIIISDNGPGIAEEELDKVLERYYRGSEQKENGCGLGFSVVQQIVDIHHASMRLTNNNGLVVTIQGNRT